ncbi:MarR family winged helix-turn-helix transcriptional regulator [Paenibacillus solisilvae]|uniref:MarR family winged helix-turn-helix transcriptional regulator n=1 Tax=Paenibacillus solisilvae TaxID=2486751 RepID=A0ABW0W416_9BACL
MDKQRQEDILQLEHTFTLMKRRMDAEWARENDLRINAMQARILVRLFEEGPQKASAIADKLQITAGAITGIADKLIDLQYLERERDVDDRRVVYLVLTDQGTQLVERLKERRTAIMEMMFTGLSQEEVRELTRLFNKVIANMDAVKE